MGATVAVATAFWLGLLQAYAPPDPDSAAFFTVWCSLAGVVFGGALLLLNSRGWTDLRVLGAITVIAVIVGGIGLSRYEGARRERVAIIREFGGGTTPYVVTDRLSEAGFNAVVSEQLCDRRAVRDNASAIVTWPCARRVADLLSAQKDLLFDEEAREASLSVLVFWYRLTAFACIFFLAILIEFGMKTLERRRKPRPPLPIPPDQI
ncbi:MAG: hypothetical protein EON85_04575 [Brevundimonas sp.]|nr:MAG: hypothetical protein EON85_04575 [Brevundimonas sp.]